MKAILKPYQEQIKQLVLTHPYCGLFLPMGMGKTLITLDCLYDLNPTNHVLIIAPKTIARSTWIDEIHKWEYPIRYKSFIVNEKGKQLSKKKRKALYEESLSAEPTIYFINRDIITDLVKYMQTKGIWRFSTIIIDESQGFKSHKSARFKALQDVVDNKGFHLMNPNAPIVTRLIELTGTPIPNGIMDLWAQIYLLDRGERLGKNITTYRQSFFYEGRRINGVVTEYIPQYGAEDEIYRRISDITFSVKNTELFLPDIIYNDIPIYMTDDEMKLYKTFVKTSVLDLNTDTQIVAANAAILTAKLSQMASGAIYIPDENGKSTDKYEVIHTHKLEMLEYIINNTNSPVIVAYHFKSDKDMILKYLSSAKIDAKPFDGTPEMIHEWNDRKIPVMLLQPASAGYGLNLQQGGHTLVWYTIPWSLEEYLQTNARLHRMGQTEPVIIHHLLTDKTIDKRILNKVLQKDATEQDLLNAVTLTLDDVLDHTTE